jgi:hypothetical protein
MGLGGFDPETRLSLLLRPVRLVKYRNKATGGKMAGLVFCRYA